MKPIKVYADTSVYGGMFDEEFSESTRTFFEQFKSGRFLLVTSIIVKDELEYAPKQVKDFFEKIREKCVIADISEEAVSLQQEYIRSLIVGNKYETDALHVAIATVSECRLIVSWNFKHIVNFQKIPLYNGVNMSKGYGTLGIHTPQEVIENEN